MKAIERMISTALLAAVVVMPVAALADALELSYTIANNSLTVTAPAGALDQSASLYLVWGPVDKESNLSDWANKKEYDGEISSDAAQYVFDISDVEENSVIRVLAQTELRFIDGYVSLGRNQYIDTAIMSTEAYGLDIKYFHANTSESLESDPFGSLIGGVLDDFTIGRYSNDFYLRWRLKEYKYALPNLSNSFATNVISIAKQKVFLNGEERAALPEDGSGSIGTKERSVLVGSTWRDSGALSGRYFPANWFYATLHDKNGKALVNLVPALRGSGEKTEAVFYDTVSKRVFVNQGSGALSYDTSAIVTNRMVMSSVYSTANSHVASATWTGGGETDSVVESANWDPTIPGNGTDVAIPATSGKIPVFYRDEIFSKFSVGTGGSANIVQDAGKLQVTGVVRIGNTANECSTVVQNGGGFSGGGSVYFASKGSTKYFLKSGSFSVGEHFYFGDGESCDALLELSDGSLSVKKCTYIGSSGKGVFTQVGGDCQCGSWTAIGRYGTGVGVCTVSGGKFSVTAYGLNIGEQGHGTLNVTGEGYVKVPSGDGIKIGDKENGSGSLNLSGNGVIETRFIKKNNGKVNGVIFDGGTLKALVNDVAFLNNLGVIELKSGGVVIDTQGKNIRIENCTFKVSDGGKITVVGGGTVTFNNVVVDSPGNVAGVYVFAERSDEGVFSGALATARDGRVKVSADNKKIQIVPSGFSVILR